MDRLKASKPDVGSRCGAVVGAKTRFWIITGGVLAELNFIFLV